MLEVSLCLQPKNDIHLELHSKVLSVANISRSNVQRWPDHWSRNAPSVLPSLCLGLEPKCQFWARNGGDQSTNILTVLTELSAKQVQTRPWITQWVNYWRAKGCPMTSSFARQCPWLGSQIAALALL